MFALGHRIAPPRFLAFIVVSAVGFALAYPALGWARGVMTGFDAGAALFMLSCIPLFGHKTAAMRASAARNDANRMMLLGVTGVVCGAILVAIGYELSQRNGLHPAGIALIIATLLLAWLFSNLVYSLHYANLYYSQDKGRDVGGIAFPGEDDSPDYSDFVYFAFTLGMTFQTSDIDITSRAIRRVVILHCFAAFVFNIGVLAFTINVLGG